MATIDAHTYISMAYAIDLVITRYGNSAYNKFSMWTHSVEAP